MADFQPGTQHGEHAGDGGEIHQNAGGSHPPLTTNQGAPVADDQNSLKAGPRGPVLLEDFILREKINHFDHERIPERVVHARGTAAHGYFELTDSLADVSKADIFQRVGERTPLFTRFFTVAGNRGMRTLATGAFRLASRETRCASARRALPTITARRGSSSSARPSRSRTISSPR